MKKTCYIFITFEEKKEEKGAEREREKEDDAK